MGGLDIEGDERLAADDADVRGGIGSPVARDAARIDGRIGLPSREQRTLATGYDREDPQPQGRVCERPALLQRGRKGLSGHRPA